MINLLFQPRLSFHVYCATKQCRTKHTKNGHKQPGQLTFRLNVKFLVMWIYLLILETGSFADTGLSGTIFLNTWHNIHYFLRIICSLCCSNPVSINSSQARASQLNELMQRKKSVALTCEVQTFDIQTNLIPEFLRKLREDFKRTNSCIPSSPSAMLLAHSLTEMWKKFKDKGTDLAADHSFGGRPCAVPLTSTIFPSLQSKGVVKRVQFGSVQQWHVWRTCEHGFCTVYTQFCDTVSWLSDVAEASSPSPLSECRAFSPPSVSIGWTVASAESPPDLSSAK